MVWPDLFNLAILLLFQTLPAYKLSIFIGQKHDIKRKSKRKKQKKGF
jgi:hypothetical protein